MSVRGKCEGCGVLEYLGADGLCDDCREPEDGGRCESCGGTGRRNYGTMTLACDNCGGDGAER